MKLGRAMAGAEARLGHGFARPELLVEALTHPSFAGTADNQRLEFLGDRVLGLVIAEALLAADPDASEGDLAPRLNALVRKETCAEVAAALALCHAAGQPVVTRGGATNLVDATRSTPHDLVLSLEHMAAVEEVAQAEQSALDHMNSDHREAIDIYAGHFGKLAGKGWTLSGFDPEGMDLALGDETGRVLFPQQLGEAADLRRVLVEMAKQGRAAIVQQA